MITQKQLRGQITELRLAFMYSESGSCISIVLRIYDSIKELVESGKIIKLTTKNETHFVHDIIDLDIDYMTYRDGERVEKGVDLFDLTGAEVYDGGEA